MGTIHVKGRINNTYLRRGEEATVERTETIDKLIERGYLSEVKCACSTDPIDGGGEPEESPEWTPPAKSATRAEWAAFMGRGGLQFESDATRADLIRQYEDYAASLPIETDDEDGPRADDLDAPED